MDGWRSLVKKKKKESKQKATREQGKGKLVQKKEDREKAQAQERKAARHRTIAMMMPGDDGDNGDDGDDVHAPHAQAGTKKEKAFSGNRKGCDYCLVVMCFSVEAMMCRFLRARGHGIPRLFV